MNNSQNSVKSLDKSWNDSLSFIDNIYVKVILYVVLILYSSTYFENINMFVSSLHEKYEFLNIIVLLLIVYLGKKCPVIGILLGISYIISLTYASSKENFFPLDKKNEQFISGTDDSSSSGGENIDYTEYANENNVESFFPGLDINSQKEEKSFNNEIKKTSSDCKSLYTPQFESVGDVCNTVNTFKDELNAQGLNSPEGFNSNVFGSPL